MSFSCRDFLIEEIKNQQLMLWRKEFCFRTQVPHALYSSIEQDKSVRE